VSAATPYDAQHRGAAGAYEAYFAGMDRTMGQKLAFFGAHFLLDPGSRVADMGCGSGSGTYQLARLNPKIEVIGVDIDPEGEDVHALLRRAPRGVQAALRVLRHRLEQRRADNALVVGVLSPGDGEGKTTLAIELALTLSEAERARVVLIDGNLEKPGVAAALGLKLPREASLSAQIRQRMNGRGRPWGVIGLGPSLAVLADPPGDDSYPSALHSLHFEAAVQALRRNFDYVVIDGPRVLGSGDANVIEATSDGVLLVARAGTTKGAALCGASRQLGERRILGVVLRDAEPPAAGVSAAGKAA